MLCIITNDYSALLLDATVYLSLEFVLKAQWQFPLGITMIPSKDAKLSEKAPRIYLKVSLE